MDVPYCPAIPMDVPYCLSRCQKRIYSLFFLCVAGVLNDFGLNPKHLGAEIGMTMVLHTNSRSLNYHPNIHTFQYFDSETDAIKYRTLPGEDFIYLILQHVLPKGFRRVRDYGFLHANAKRLLSLVQLVLHVIIHEVPYRGRPAFKCPLCKSPMVAIGFRLKPG